MGLKFCASVDFSLLPAHIISHILGYLKLVDFKKASTVCKSWYYASTDPKIVKTLILQPKEEDFPEICKTNRRYGVLSLHLLPFDKVDSHYFELFEKFGPFITKLQIFNCDLKIHHLLKLLEFTTNLEVISFYQCSQLIRIRKLFPKDYDCKAQNRIVKNLAGIKNIELVQFSSIPFMADLIKCATNLETFESSNVYFGETYENFFSIFDNYDASNLTHLYWNIEYSTYVDDFLTRFVKIKNLNLKSFGLFLRWNWENENYKSSLFCQFILKLQNLVEFSIQGLRQDQLSLICQYLVNLNSLDCRLIDNDQPISELANLKQLKKLRCGFPRNNYKRYSLDALVQIDQFFKSKFEYLQRFCFEEFVTESNLVQLCENHPNLIELELTGLLTRNLEIIFKHLTKLRVIYIYFGFEWLRPRRRNISVYDVPFFDSKREYEYNVSRLHDLEVLHLSELVNGIREDDVRQLKNLRSTNLLELFSKHNKPRSDNPRSSSVSRICNVF